MEKEEGPLRVAKAAAPPENSRAFGDGGGGEVSAAPRGKLIEVAALEAQPRI